MIKNVKIYKQIAKIGKGFYGEVFKVGTTEGLKYTVKK
jgi:hypothetical protein